MTEKELIFDTCLKMRSRVNTTRVRIYNLIRSVGRGELTADNALHQLMEDYHELGVTEDALCDLADKIRALKVFEESE